MNITREEVIKLAELSMLEFNDAEIDALTRDFQEFLGYVQEIMNVDIAGEQNSMQRINVFREDKSITKDREDILNQAPSRYEDYFAVPSILETPED